MQLPMSEGHCCRQITRDDIWMSKLRRSTDYGTVVLHMGLVIAFAIAAATGLRIAADDPDTEWLRRFDPLLPVDHLWFRHLIAGLFMTALLAGYFAYVRGARLQARVRLDKARVLVMTRPGRQRWAAVNVVVFWVLMCALVVAILSGFMMVAGAGHAVIAVHRLTTYVCLGSIAAHVALHAAFGGLSQIARIVRPSRLVVAEPPPDLADLLAEQLAKQHETANAVSLAEPDPVMPRSRPPQEPTPSRQPPVVPGNVKTERIRATTLHANPFVTGITVAFAIGGVTLGAEQATRETLQVPRIGRGEAPKLDGDLSDPAWTLAKPVKVLTTQGGDFGGTHQSMVEIRAVHDGEFAYLAFVWEDPTRSLKHLPLVKRDGHWRVAAGREDLGDEQRFHEDKFAVLLAQPGLPLLGAAIHLARRPLADKPASGTGRGLHYTTGGIADVWQWRASHGGANGHIDNCHFGPPADAPAGTSRYSGGFQLDPGQLPYRSNIADTSPLAGATWVVPDRLPRDIEAMRKVLGPINDAPAASEGEAARWWMTLSESVAFSSKLDAAIPDGSVIPGVVVNERAEPSRDSIRGVARWAAGRWTLELARRLYTDSPYDVPIKTGNLMWVAAFDHAEKRHTRHLRPFKLEVD
jgi:cytochrome b subunit of formate dehydrogenase